LPFLASIERKIGGTVMLEAINNNNHSQKIIMDPIHGGIPIWPHEELVINSPLFQRLNHVRQNDILFMVFPGATHTRFSHSIGAMHIAGRLFSTISSKYLNSFSKLNDKQNSEVNESITYIYHCLRLAVLLHDTGHGPFSHLFESCEEIKRILSLPSTFDSLWKGIYWKRYIERPKSLNHEHYSIRCAIEILRSIDKHSLPVKIEDVISIMEHAKIAPSKTLISHMNILLQLINLRFGEINKGRKFKLRHDLDEKSLAKEIINFCKRILSGEVDADKMDYLVRDSYFSGCNYGAYNVDHLIHSLCIGFDIANTKKPWIGLAIQEKGLSALENFVHSRFQLYQNLYNHKTVVGFKWIFEQAMKEIFGEMTTNKKVKREASKLAENSLKNIEKFTYFTDEFIWNRLQNIAYESQESYSYMLINRKKLKYLCSAKNLNDFEINIRKGELCEQNPELEIHSAKAPSTFSKISNANADTIRLYIETNRVEKNSEFSNRLLMAVIRKTDFFQKFRDINVTHFYQKPALVPTAHLRKSA